MPNPIKIMRVILETKKKRSERHEVHIAQRVSHPYVIEKSGPEL